MDEQSWILGLSVALLVFLFGCFAGKVLWPWRGQQKGLLARCVHRLRRKTLEPEQEAVERRVREECLRRRVERAGILLAVGSLFMAYDVVLIIQKALAETPTLNLQQALILQSFILVRAIMGCFPKMLTPMMVDTLYCVSIASIICWVSFVAPTTVFQVVAWRAGRLVLFLYWSLFDLKPVLNAIGALCLVSFETVLLVRMGGMVLPAWYVYSFGLVGLFGIDYCLRQSVRFEILATDSKSELTAVQALLNSICDVVVLLDGRLRLKHHTPKLADVLMQPACRNLEGVDLRDYMVADTDRETFSRHLRIPDGSAAQADVFHARLRDSTNSSVAMEFFAVGFKSHDGGHHHIVGMREHTDIQPLARQEDVPPPPPVQVVMPRHRRAEENEQPLLHLGTPRTLEQGDLNTHRADSASASGRSAASEESDSDTGQSSSDPAAVLAFWDQAVANGGLPDLMLETAEIAKTVTLNYLMMAWVLKGSRHSCCPKHALIAEVQRLISGMAAQDCVPDYLDETTWQCRRCGIKAEEHRDPKHKRRCLLCKNLDDCHFQGLVGGGHRTMAAL